MKRDKSIIELSFLEGRLIGEAIDSRIMEIEEMLKNYDENEELYKDYTEEKQILEEIWEKHFKRFN